LNFVLDYAVRKVQEKHLENKLTGTHQLLAWTDDVNLLGHNINAYKGKQKFKEVGLEVNAEKIKYMLLPRHQNAGQNRDIS
jgi:hypothetical protein